MTKMKNTQKTQKTPKSPKQNMDYSFFLQNRTKTKMEIIALCVITFGPIKVMTRSAPQNDRLNLSFVKNEHTYFEKMARIGRNTVIYKGTFVSNQSLPST